jgi:hypothetical protein
MTIPVAERLITTTVPVDRTASAPSEVGEGSAGSTRSCHLSDIESHDTDDAKSEKSSSPYGSTDDEPREGESVKGG